MGEETQTYLDNTGQNHYNYFAKMVFVCAPRNFAGAKERNDLNMANMKKEYKMSAERKEELQKELTYLKTVREKEVADLIKEARGFGDLSENSEYDEAKNEQGKLYSVSLRSRRSCCTPSSSTKTTRARTASASVAV